MKAFTMRLMHMGKEVYFLTETITPNFGPAICLSFLPLPVRQHNWWHWRKSTSVWRRCGGVNHESTRHYHRVCRRHRANQCPFQNQKDSVFRSAQPMASLYEQALLVIADALVMKMAAESGAPESELFKRHANLE